MNEKLLDFIKFVGVPAVISLVLAYVLLKTLDAQQEERTQHAAILVDQISDLRDRVGKCIK